MTIAIVIAALALSGTVFVAVWVWELSQRAADRIDRVRDDRPRWWCGRCNVFVPVDVWQTDALCDTVCRQCGDVLDTYPMGID